MNRTLKTAGLALAAVAVVGAIAALVVRDQLDRHQRNLFNPYPLRRLACLGHLAGAEASVSNITLLRDFVAWEPKKLLRNRARVILKRMEDQALEDGSEISEARGES